MARPQIIGITGGIGGGKTTFSYQLREFGQLVYDSDVRAKELQNSDSALIRAIKSEFGENIYHENGLNRSALAKIVFSVPKKLKILNAIVHPIVINDFSNWIYSHRDRTHLFMESAILYEANFDKFVDKVVVVSAPEEVRIKRVMRRDGLSKKDVILRISNQLDEKEKIKKADWYYNTDNKIDPEERVKSFLNIINE